MPYVSSKDREILNPLITCLARKASSNIDTNFSVIKVYKYVFLRISRRLRTLVSGRSDRGAMWVECMELADSIYDIGQKYGYEGAYLGELNYAMTRFIQE